MIKYAPIVFQQGDDATEALKILQTSGLKKCIDHLIQWADGQALEFSETSSSGTDDHFFRQEQYLLTYNLRLGYVGLERITGHIAS